MKKEKTNLVALFIILIVAVFILFLAISFFPDQEIILEGEPAIEFCEQKCVDKELGDLTYSVNNSEYNVTECECVTKEVHGEGKYNPVIRIETRGFYFDSITLEEISNEEVELRLE